MQSVSSRVWTRVAVFISDDDNNYTTGTSITEKYKAYKWLQSVLFKKICLNSLSYWKESHDVMANLLDKDIELQSCYYVHFRTNTIGKGMKLILSQLLVR